MANTLTDLIPTIYTALDVVSRELVGFIPNVAINAASSSAAVGQTINAHVVPQGTLEDITPGVNPADSGDVEPGITSVTITKSKAYPIRWNGEEQLALGANGQYNLILADQFAQAFRTLTNAVEADLAGLYTSAARATGTAGTTPFSSVDDHSDWANANMILDQLGAPQVGRVMIVGHAARAKIEGVQSGLFKVNEAGDQGAMLRMRQSRELHGFTMGYSSGIKSHTKGSGAGWLTNSLSGYNAGDSSIALDTGTGTVLAGDVVTFAGDATKYVVKTALSAGTLALNSPGLAFSLADNKALTTENNYTANLFFHRSAMLLAARAPAMPVGGDSADDVMQVTDPISGLTFQVAMYRQYRQVKYEIGLAWGVAAPNGKHMGILLG